MRTTIPLTARAPRTFTPPALLEQFEKKREEWSRTPDKKRAERPEKPAFYIAVPTLTERETIAQLMYELGLNPVGREDVRNATLRAILDSEDADAEDTATWLEGFWQQQALYEQHLEIWEQQENQRVIDEFRDPKTKREAFPTPGQLTSLKDRVRAKEVVDKVVASSPGLRRLLGQQTVYGKKYDLMSLRVHLRGWENLTTPREAEGMEGMPDLVTEECLEQLRDEIGNTAWRELIVSIDSMYSLTTEEVGNFALPPGSGSMNDGSIPAGELVTDAGTSPGSETEPTRSDLPPTQEPASDQTTEPS